MPLPDRPTKKDEKEASKVWKGDTEDFINGEASNIFTKSNEFFFSSFTFLLYVSYGSTIFSAILGECLSSERRKTNSFEVRRFASHSATRMEFPARDPLDPQNRFCSLISYRKASFFLPFFLRASVGRSVLRPAPLTRLGPPWRAEEARLQLEADVAKYFTRLVYCTYRTWSE